MDRFATAIFLTHKYKTNKNEMPNKLWKIRFYPPFLINFYGFDRNLGILRNVSGILHVN